MSFNRFALTRQQLRLPSPSTALEVVAPAAEVAIQLDSKSILAKSGELRSDQELTFLSTWLLSLNIPFFSHLTHELLFEISRHLRSESHPANEWIFRQGERGDTFYVILEGRVVIVVDKQRQMEMDEARAKLDRKKSSRLERRPTTPKSPKSPKTPPSQDPSYPASQSQSVANSPPSSPKVSKRTSMLGRMNLRQDDLANSRWGDKKAAEDSPPKPHHLASKSTELANSPAASPKPIHKRASMLGHMSLRQDDFANSRWADKLPVELEPPKPAKSTPPVEVVPPPPTNPIEATPEAADFQLVLASANSKLTSTSPAAPTLTLQQQLHGLIESESIVGELGIGQGFGEVALISKTNNFRQASVKTIQPCVFLCLNKQAYDLALKVQHEKTLNTRMNWMREMYLFKRWSYEKLVQFVLCLQEVTYKKDHVIYHEKDPCDSVYFILSGEVEISITEPDTDSSAPNNNLYLLTHPSDSDSDSSMYPSSELRLRWVGRTYLRDKVLPPKRRRRPIEKPPRRMKSSPSPSTGTKSSPRARSKQQPNRVAKWIEVKSRYMDYMKHTEASRERASFYLPPTEEELQEELRREEYEKRERERQAIIIEKNTELVFEQDPDYDNSDDDYTSSSTESTSSSSTDSAKSDDDEYTKAHRAARKAAALRNRARIKAAQRKERRLRREQKLPPTPSGQHQELKITDQFFNQFLKDGVTQYQFYKVHFQSGVNPDSARDKTNVTPSPINEERCLKIVLKPQFIPANASSSPITQGMNQQQLFESSHLSFELFAGNAACPYPTKLKHTWSAPTPIAPKQPLIDRVQSQPQKRTIILRPNDPNFHNGWFYFAVYHGINEEQIREGRPPTSAASSSKDPVNVPYELSITNEPFSLTGRHGRGWLNGSKYHPERIFKLAHLSTKDFFGAEEVIAHFEASNTGDAPIGTTSSLDPRIPYFELGRISTARVISPTATVLMIPKDSFMTHIRGGVLKDFKAILSKQLQQRDHILETQRWIDYETKNKTRPPERSRPKDYKERRVPLKDSIPLIRPQSAQPLTTMLPSDSASDDSQTVALVDSSQPSLHPSTAAPYHFRPNLSTLGALTQSNRIQLEYAYHKSVNELRLKRKVEEQFYQMHPDTLPTNGSTENGQSQVNHRSKPHELWALDPDEQEQLHRKKLLERLRQEEEEQTIIYRREKPTNQPKLRPSTAPGPRLLKQTEQPHAAAIKAEQPLLLMPPSSNDAAQSQSQALILRPETVPSDSNDQSLVPTSHPLNTVPTFQILPLSTKRELAEQNRMALKLFGVKLHHHSMSTPTTNSTALVTTTGNTVTTEVSRPTTPSTIPTTSSSTGRPPLPSEPSACDDGPIYGLQGSSPLAGSYSLAGQRLSNGPGLRLKWQDARYEPVFAAVAKRERVTDPFAHPTLYNPWLYIPSLYDSAAHDPQLNHLAIKLGIPQPKPAPQPKDKSNTFLKFRPLDTEEKESELIEDELRQKRTQSSTDSKKMSVEEALKLAENEMAHATHSRPPSSLAATVADVPTLAEKDVRPPVVCPVPNSLWQSELALLSSPPPAKSQPFVMKTSLASFAPYVVYEPLNGTTTEVPQRYQNPERRHQQEVDEQAKSLLTTMNLLMPAAVTTNKSEEPPSDPVLCGSNIVTAHVPTPPLAGRSSGRSRPGSASMFGSFIVRQTSALAATKEKKKRTSMEEQKQQQPQQQLPSAEAAAASPPSNSTVTSEEDASTIFSLTQIGSTVDQDAQRMEETKEQEQQPQALILHPTVAIEQPPASSSRPTSPIRTSHREHISSAGNRFLIGVSPDQLVEKVKIPANEPESKEATIDVVGRIPQRRESAQDAAQRQAILQVLANQRAQYLTLTDRIAASRTTFHPYAGRTEKPARMALKNARLRAQARPHRPPTIPTRTQPRAVVLEAAGYEAELRRQEMAHPSLERPTQRPMTVVPRAFRKVGHRKDYQARSALDKANVHQQPPSTLSLAQSLSPQSHSRPMSAASTRQMEYHSTEYQPELFYPPSSILYPGFNSTAPIDSSSWDQIDIVDEGERFVPQTIGRFDEQDVEPSSTPFLRPQSAAAATFRPHPPSRPSPTTPTTTNQIRPSSAVLTPFMASGGGSGDFSDSFPLSRPTSAFPRPPSATANTTSRSARTAAAAHFRNRPQSAFNV